MAFPKTPVHVVAFILAITAGAHASDPEGKANLAAASALPSGRGFSTGLPAADLKSHASVIFSEDFEDGDIGARWDDVIDPDKAVLSYSPTGDEAGLGKRCLRVRADLAKNTGGGLTKWFEPPDTVFVRFYTRFEPGCDYTHHFAGLRGNKGLTGADRWSGFGKAGIKPQGDEKFSTRIEPWGENGRWAPPGRWNFYSYWHGMEPSGDGKYWGNSFGVPSAPLIPHGKWICVEFMLRHNTPGEPDGEQAFWIDGVLQGHWKGINWRKTAGLKANALNLESYVTDRWTKNPINIVSFDEVVVAGAYIGPAVME